MPVFGEKIWYKKRDKPKDRSKSDPGWEKAIWLGHARDSNESIVGTPQGAFKAYAIKRIAEAERWDAEMIRNVKGTPQQPDPEKKGIRVPISVRFDVGEAEEVQAHPVQEGEEPAARRRGITQVDLDKYGYTPGCPGCLAKQRGEVAKKGHSEACRKRIEDLMREDAEDKKKIEASDERITHQIARRIELADRKRQPEPDAAVLDDRDQMREGEEEADRPDAQAPDAQAEDDEMNDPKDDMDAEMEDESRERNSDVVMTLGRMLLEISRVDPVVQEWTNRVSKGKRRCLSCLRVWFQ